MTRIHGIKMGGFNNVWVTAIPHFLGLWSFDFTSLLLFSDFFFSMGDFQQDRKCRFSPFKYELYTSSSNMAFPLFQRQEHRDRCFRLARFPLQVSLKIKYFFNSFISTKSSMHFNLVLLIQILCGYPLYSCFLSPGHSLPEFSGMRLNFYLLPQPRR